MVSSSIVGPSGGRLPRLIFDISPIAGCVEGKKPKSVCKLLTFSDIRVFREIHLFSENYAMPSCQFGSTTQLINQTGFPPKKKRENFDWWALNHVDLTPERLATRIDAINYGLMRRSRSRSLTLGVIS